MNSTFKTHISGKIRGHVSEDLPINIHCVQTGKSRHWNNAVREGWFCIKNPRTVEIKGEPDFYVTYLSPEGEKEWREKNDETFDNQ
jgi:hypothetical protein